MGTTVAFAFPWGRYHATPWDRSVNEAVVEWPPSPWRILRALYATWRQRAKGLDADTVERVLGALVDPPRYLLPADFTEAHTRHYMPDIKHRQGISGHTAKTLDPMVVTARGAEVLVQWPVQLGEPERACLAELVAKVPYLGRAEAIVCGRLVSDVDDVPGWLEPIVGGDDRSVQRVLVPTAPLDLAALVATPSQVRAAGLLVPPGTRWVRYPPPESAAVTPPRARRARSLTTPTSVRFAVTSSAPPTKFTALAAGELLRRAAMSKFGAVTNGGVSATLSGKNAAGQPSSGPHDHAHYLPIIDQRGLLSAMVVWAPRGLQPDEVAALERIEKLRAPSHQTIEGLSGRDVALGAEAIGSIAETAPELADPPSTQWRSVTPFVMTRHSKQELEVALTQNVVLECERRRLPAPRTVEIARDDWLSFRRARLIESIRQSRRAFGLRLTFDHPISGPLALGQFSHFGLGLFAPVDGEPQRDRPGR